MSRLFPVRTRLRRLFAGAIVIPVLTTAILIGTYVGISYMVLALVLGGLLVLLTWQRMVKVSGIYERALRDAAASSLKTRTILESITDAFCALDGEWMFTYINKEAEKIFGKPRGEMIGRGIWEQFPQFLNSLFFRECHRAMEQQHKIDFVFFYDTVEKWFEAHVYPSSDGLAVYLRDVTARREAEEALRKSHLDLEKRVTERTQELTAANKELEAFSYSVSHDLRGPLRSIDGFSQALLEDYSEKLDVTGRDYLQRVRAATQRMGRLIDDLLNLSRLSRSEMRMEWVDLSRIAKEIAIELKRQQPHRNVTFQVAEGVKVKGDEGLLRVVLENLLGNAWKFTARHDNAEIAFGVKEVKGHQVFFVKDDGSGFDMAYGNKLFGAFQRLHKDQDFSGTGIGLATVRRIVHRHGGHVWAEGTVEKGATFFFDLEAREAVPLGKVENSIASLPLP